MKSLPFFMLKSLLRFCDRCVSEEGLRNCKPLFFKKNAEFWRKMGGVKKRKWFSKLFLFCDRRVTLGAYNKAIESELLKSRKCERVTIMKQLLKRALVSALAISMVASVTSVSAFAAEPAAAAEPITVDMERSGFDEEENIFNVYMTINEGATGTLKVDLATTAIEILNEYAKEVGMSNYPTLPGDSNPFRVYITNESGQEFAYQQGSLDLSTRDVSGDGLSPFVGFDGQNIPYHFVGAIGVANRAIYQNLFGVSGSNKVTTDMLFGIYDTLADKGYEGTDALTRFLLDYYSDWYNREFASWDELITAYPTLGDTFAIAGSNGIYTMSYSKMEAYCNEHPELAPYVYYESAVANPSGSDEVKVQIKWPEEKLAVFSYNAFYQDFFSFAFGENNFADLEPNGNTTFTRTRGVGDYMDTSSELYKEADAYFAGLDNADSLTDGETLALAFKWALDGPGIGNGYMNYKFSYDHSIALVQVKEEEEIPDNPPPLDPGTDEEIPDNEVPLAPGEETVDENDVPKTGDAAPFAATLFGLMTAAVVGGVAAKRRLGK